MSADSESTVMRNAFPTIIGNNTIPSGENYPFNNLEPLADYFNGFRLSELHPDVRNDLGPYIIPSNYTSRPLLPNFFVEAKGPDGKASEMKLQIT
jgi:hypothetical protein